MTLVWPISNCIPNLVQIGQEMAEIYLFMYFQYGGRPPSWIFRKVWFLAPVTLVWPKSICTPSLVQIGQQMTEIYQFMYFQYGGRLPSWILKSEIFGNSDPFIANIYLHTKFGANRSRNGRDIALYVFPIWRPSAILDFRKSEIFGTSDPCMANI